MAEAEKYRIVRRVGRGGMAEVLEAIAVGAGGFERRVAVKRMLPEHGDNPAFARMFVQEARLASLVHHANIASVVDFGVADGVPFQVMEFVDGADTRSLQEQAADLGESMSVEVALHVTTEVAHALAYAHRARGPDGVHLGIVHRDVSPRNILVSWHGDVKLTDFGIAFSKDRAERTRAGTTKGTPKYMAPEQTLGGEVDQRTDLFSLGCVLHTLITGKSPLSVESNMVTLLSGADMELSPGLPEDVREIVARATRYAKGDRYQSGTDMAAATGAALHRRIQGDPKSMMLEWLANIRPPSRLPEPRGRLDDLLNPELVLEGTQNDVRRFVVAQGAADPQADTQLADSRRGAGAEATTEVERRAPPPEATRTPSSVPPPPVLPLFGSRLPVAGLVALTFAGSIGAWLAWPHGRPDGASPIPGAPAVASPAASGASSSAAVPVAPTSLAPAAPSAREPSTPASAAAGRPRSRPATTPSASEDPRPPAVGTATGSLLVAGEGALRAEIFVDGQSVGFAPKELELPVGAHTLALVAPDGRHLGTTTVTLSARNTPSSPLVWRLP